MNLLLKLTKRRPHIRLMVPAVPREAWVVIVAGNGQTLLTSETYSSIGAARRAAIALSVDTGWAIKEVKP